ncbi:RNA polymerase sigma factor [uncultured Tenacibaculum sp.]|uniref:RNA polymerase sigma factor n=1 Tax=uncultured Tenacibaculum sp. TaxID=174713 RepID=UPI002620DC43|nr:RNA polymerase sigma factor [uncultured Tenacibaculum sp.]
MKILNNITDKELVLSYKQGNQKAFTTLVKKWHVDFCKLAFWYVKDRDIAKDVAQESWQVILHKLDKLEKPERFKSWAISIVNRKAIDWLRTNKRVLNKHQKYYKEHMNDVVLNEVNEEDEVKNNLLKAIQKLSIEQQMVVKLFYTQSYSLKEISEFLNISVGTAKSRLFHAREKLKKIIKK